MLPAFPQSSLTQGYQSADREHERVALRLRRWFVDERTDAGVVFIVNKISIVAMNDWSQGGYEFPYIRSSWTLWSPDGSDLNSTLSARSTKPVSSMKHGHARHFHVDLHPAVARFHAMVYLSLP